MSKFDVVEEVIMQLSSTAPFPDDFHLRLLSVVEIGVLKRPAGLCPSIDLQLLAEPPSSELLENIRQMVVLRLAREGLTPQNSSLIDILRIFRHQQHVPLFDAWLLQRLQDLLSAAADVSALLMAASDSDEKVYPSHRTSMGPDEVDRNIRDARSYLKRKLGVSIPW